LLWRMVLPTLTATLDDRAAKIRDDIDRAATLKTEAEALLKTYKAQMDNAQAEATNVITRARKEAEDIAQQRRADLDDELRDKAQEAASQIEYAKNAAIDELRGEVARIAAAAAERIVAGEITPQKAEKYTDDVLKEMAN